MALALKTLVEANEMQPCLFAVRGNGHTPSPGHANIENGVVIDLGLMNSTTYNAKNKTASVLPGATWGMVYAAIEPFNVMVAGGRSYSVGVSGLAIGGGNSFYSPRVGMVCDGIVQLEVVLANGDIVYANRDNHSDLLQVHKGGSGNYGIVTRLDLATFPASDLWGGVVVYPNRTADQMFDAMHKLVPKLHDDPYASVIMFGTYTSLDATTTFINLYEYTKPVARPPIFDDFLAVPGNITDTMRMTNMTDLVYELEQPEHYRWVSVVRFLDQYSSSCRIRFYSLTFKNDIRVMHKANELFNEAVEAIKPIGSGDYKVQYLFQPFPAFYADRSKERGGNILGLDRNSDDLICQFAAHNDSSLGLLLTVTAS